MPDRTLARDKTASEPIDGNSIFKERSVPYDEELKLSRDQKRPKDQDSVMTLFPSADGLLPEKSHDRNTRGATQDRGTGHSDQPPGKRKSEPPSTLVFSDDIFKSKSHDHDPLSTHPVYPFKPNYADSDAVHPFNPDKYKVRPNNSDSTPVKPYRPETDPENPYNYPVNPDKTPINPYTFPVNPYKQDGSTRPTEKAPMPTVELPVVAPGMRPFTAATVAKEGPDGVDQTSHGDCVFESTVAGLAGTSRGRELIANMITMGNNGDYIVKFPGEAIPVIVKPSDVLNTEAIKDSAGWARILQAALVKTHPEFAEAKVPKDAPGGTDGDPPTPAQYAAYLLTGQTALKADANDRDAAKYIQTAIENGSAIVAFCKDSNDGSLVSHHEWTVLDYDPNTQEITVRNPWGRTDEKKIDGIEYLGEGRVRMPFSVFQKNFGEITSLGFPKPQSTFEWLVEELNPLNWF